ncbi:MAG: Phd YefM protein [Devosia sp.]|uniref:type II toxin-antitoxin system Phd/YefM family antitoxin n=1 Tax=Devosia sp. TaxID=1871048 RepID=UPI00262E873B|nr:type II toxin-antitoxin system Phd/YefM family antitoxin [Devosia sp.]MDB5542671.1 Phd YefM protein [Devosia sp.]
MKRMQLRDAKAHLSEVVESAIQGEPVTITRHGTPVAMVVPFSKGEEIYPPKPKLSFVEHLLAFPGGIDLELERDHTPPREIDL